MPNIKKPKGKQNEPFCDKPVWRIRPARTKFAEIPCSARKIRCLAMRGNRREITDIARKFNIAIRRVDRIQKIRWLIPWWQGIGVTTLRSTES
jgi:hypothetical protein